MESKLRIAVLANGVAVPLANVVELRARGGFEGIRHAQARLAVQVSADVDTAVNNPSKILAGLQRSVLPDLAALYGVDYSFEGRSADPAETLGDMRRGALLALILIYLVLAWVFASYGWPVVVMTVIPFGIVGAVVGHWLLGIDLTVLSLFGMFGLAGIVINDSIILVMFFKQLKASGMELQEALIEASC
jgi:multidrug efflux pump subunit AcrB